MQEYKPIKNIRSALGTSPKPKVHPWYALLQKSKVRLWYELWQNSRFALGTHFYKTQGTPLSCSLAKITTTTTKGPSSTKRTTTILFGKTFNQVKVIRVPHNHQRRSFTGQDDDGRRRHNKTPLEPKRKKAAP